VGYLHKKLITTDPLTYVRKSSQSTSLHMHEAHSTIDHLHM